MRGTAIIICMMNIMGNVAIYVNTQRVVGASEEGLCVIVQAGVKKAALAAFWGSGEQGYSLTFFSSSAAPSLVLSQPF